VKDKYEFIADFPITINLRFRNVSKQAGTLVALAYETGATVSRDTGKD